MLQALAMIILALTMKEVSGDIFEAARVSTIEDLEFESKHILSLTVHTDGSLLVSQSNILWQVDLRKSPPRKTHIVGSELNGYQEGTGINATFRRPGSVMTMSSTHVLVADTYNHCLRQVDLSNKTVTRFAGQCTIEGFQDGDRLKRAKFDSPWSVVKMNGKIIISDRFNDAIRVIENDFVSTLVTGSPIDEPRSLLLYSHEQLYIAVTKGVLAINLTDTEDLTTLLSFKERANCDGLTRIASNGFLFTTLDSNIKLAGLDDSKIRSEICKIGGGVEDGNITQCGFAGPSCMTVYNGSVLIGQAKSQYLKKLTLPILRDTARIRCPGDIEIAVENTSGNEFVNVTWDSPDPDYEEGLECIKCPDTHQRIRVSTIPVTHTYRYKYMDHRWNQQVECSFTVTLKSVKHEVINEYLSALIAVSVSGAALFIILVIVIISFLTKLRAVTRDREIYRKIASSSSSTSTTYPSGISLPSTAELTMLPSNDVAYPYETISESSYMVHRHQYDQPHSNRNRELPQPNQLNSPEDQTVYEGPWSGRSSPTTTNEPYYSDKNHVQQRINAIFKAVEWQTGELGGTNLEYSTPQSISLEELGDDKRSSSNRQTVQLNGPQKKESSKTLYNSL